MLALQPVLAVRFCPVLFERLPASRNGEEESLSKGALDLPYRMVFALATLDAVVIYDTAGDVCAIMLSDTPWYEPCSCLTYEIACHKVPVHLCHVTCLLRTRTVLNMCSQPG
jgi:hypothetical protein